MHHPIFYIIYSSIDVMMMMMMILNIDRGFGRSRWVRRQANEMGWILWSMDWRGLTRHDLPQFARLLMYDMGKVSWFLQSVLTQVLEIENMLILWTAV
jgi:hypothetical protein